MGSFARLSPFTKFFMAASAATALLAMNGLKDPGATAVAFALLALAGVIADRPPPPPPRMPDAED